MLIRLGRTDNEGYALCFAPAAACFRETGEQAQAQVQEKGPSRRTLILQTSSEVPQNHPCIDKSHDKKEDGDNGCSDVRRVTIRTGTDHSPKVESDFQI
jgi:hypothetical protein